MIPALEIENVSVKFGKRQLFRNVSLKISAGEFVTIMGDNGVGKTTLTDVIFGNRMASSGEIRFWGNTLERDPRSTLLRTSRVIAETEMTNPFVTVDEFLRLWSSLRTTWNDQIASQLASQFGLDKSKRMSHLSLGEHTKVKLVKALASQPKLLVLDELTANLSPNSRDVVIKTVLELFSENKMAVLYVSHAVDEATRLSDRLYEMTSEGLFERGVA